MVDFMVEKHFCCQPAPLRISKNESNIFEALLGIGVADEVAT